MITYRPTLNRNGRANADGTRTIVITIYDTATRERVALNTHLRVSPSDFMHGQLLPGDERARLVNRKIRRLILQLMQREDELESSHVTCTPRRILDAFIHHLTPTATMSEWVESVITPSGRKSSTKDSYRTLAKSIEEFRSGTTLSDITYDFIERYRQWLSAEKQLSYNTVIGRLKALRCLVSEAVKRDVITTDPFRNVVIGEMKARREHLTISEVRRLERVQLTPKLAHVRDAFLFCVYTGLRWSDFRALRSGNLHGSRLVVDQLKTGHLVELPLDRMFGGRPLEMIERYGTPEQLAAIGTNPHANRCLQQVAELCRIRKHLHWHCARKACATLLNQAGLQMQEIQFILGHQRLSTTSRFYARTVYGQVEKSLKKAFKV